MLEVDIELEPERYGSSRSDSSEDESGASEVDDIDSDAEYEDGSEEWLARERARRRRAIRKKRRLLNITSTAHRERVDQAFEAKRRTQLLQDIELGRRIEELIQAKVDANETAKARLTSEAEMNLVALLKGVK